MLCSDGGYRVVHNTHVMPPPSHLLATTCLHIANYDYLFTAPTHHTTPQGRNHSQMLKSYTDFTQAQSENSRGPI